MDNNYAGLMAAKLGAEAAQSASSQMPAAVQVGAPEIAKSFSAQYSQPIAEAKASADVYNSQVKIEQERMAAAAAASSASARKEKYQRVKKANGGFDFFDADGQKITAQQYAMALETTPDKVLAGSENPNDIRYIQDFNDLQDYIIASGQKDSNPDSKAMWDGINKAVYDAQGIELWKMNPQEVIDSFRKAYPSVYGMKEPSTIKPNSSYYPSMKQSTAEDTSQSSDW